MINVIKTFKSDDLEQWALFSSDRNPIHFDEVYIKENGLDFIVVHGMLAMIPIKISIDDHFRNQDFNYLEIKINLKSAIPVKQEIQYLIDFQKNKFNIVNADNISLYAGIVKKCNDIVGPITKDFNSRAILSLMPSEQLQKKQHDFKKFVHVNSSNWIFWDALLFFFYISNNDKSPLANDARRYLIDNLGVKDGNNVTVYQVTHNLIISKSLFSSQNSFSIDDITVFTEGKDLIEFNGILFGSVMYYFFVNDVLLMSQEMVLAAKPK
ncbi:Acyl-CoA dehydratase PaaZ (MaoC) (PDB:5ZY8) [Commensalibacter communis]|uniref:MaoC/PaaZ C-terminal domain-containing protein n=1 Tax=Commensalibacter communis TaxID=2972786 RepID=UPI0022FF8CF8|nr:MaoC/PaaZ C-terminal domain-containing protein [Commensalibacter communis]CAI3954205.1 Acyl-CoA dehydratase PaaZ (MaoC) (PDB:5ZY8) [Commensalibacter communis]CAI3954990.1 Acyl-CoA dehydratase PaaZ (MaoC) (PDB:5ZY8) [Commensalibacter communis]